ncbi:hypothetical protein F5887DRAFT_914898 [Amanita rubescens]|nr:hypothetical protein F5887DRAFT_914898 [Amanita rubescens]
MTECLWLAPHPSLQIIALLVYTPTFKSRPIPTGATSNGNPIGGLAFSSAFGQLEQTHEWMLLEHAGQLQCWCIELCLGDSGEVSLPWRACDILRPARVCQAKGIPERVYAKYDFSVSARGAKDERSTATRATTESDNVDEKYDVDDNLPPRSGDVGHQYRLLQQIQPQVRHTMRREATAGGEAIETTGEGGCDEDNTHITQRYVRWRLPEVGSDGALVLLRRRLLVPGSSINSPTRGCGSTKKAAVVRNAPTTRNLPTGTETTKLGSNAKQRISYANKNERREKPKRCKLKSKKTPCTSYWLEKSVQSPG